MAVRILMLLCFMLAELALGIIGFFAVDDAYRFQPWDSGANSTRVLLGFGVAVGWLATIAIFLRKGSRRNANQIVAQARTEAARILSEATDKALALTSMEYGKCRNCGNPRTGKYCPKCGQAAAVGQPA